MNLNSYNLSRAWFDFCFENPEKINPTHTALYMFAIEYCNRLGWKEKFGLPTEMAKDAIGVKSWHTYIKAFNDIIEFGFFKLIERSKNQYSSNIIALINFDKALDKALDKAITKHISKQLQSTYQSIDSIIKQLNQEQLNQEQLKELKNVLKKYEKLNPEEKSFTRPSIDEVKSYFLENGYSEESAVKAFRYYDVAAWKDSKGNQVRNWKQKMQAVWFKDENRKQQPPKPQMVY